MKLKDMIQPIDQKPAKAEPLHVDEWIQNHGFDDKPEHGGAMYARWMMMHFRLPACMQSDFARFIGDKKLFCTFEGKRYRCTGGSRLGDVWLTKDFKQEVGYQKRVDVNKCLAWSDRHST